MTYCLALVISVWTFFKSSCYQSSSSAIKILKKCPWKIQPETCKFCSLKNVPGNLNRLPAFFPWLSAPSQGLVRPLVVGIGQGSLETPWTFTSFSFPQQVLFTQKNSKNRVTESQVEWLTWGRKEDKSEMPVFSKAIRLEKGKMAQGSHRKE